MTCPSGLALYSGYHMDPQVITIGVRCQTNFNGYRCIRDLGHRRPGCEPSLWKEAVEPSHAGRWCPTCACVGKSPLDATSTCCGACEHWDWRGRDTRRYTPPIKREV